MRKVWIVAAIVAASLAGGPEARAADELFTENVAGAIQQAKTDGKDLYWHFTGTDWCGWCMKLDKEVYQHDAFKKAVTDRFVMISLDFPRKRVLPDEVKKQNAKWKNTFGVTGFPTIYLTDADQRPYAKTGYRPGGPEKYAAHLIELQGIRVKRDKAFAAAAKAEGLAKAKLLDEGLSAMGESIALKFYQDEVAEIITLDAEDEAGLKSKWSQSLAVTKLSGEVEGLLRQRKLDDALAKLNAGIQEIQPTGQAAQGLYFFQARLLFQKDKAASKAALQKALEAAPKSKQAAQIRQILAKAFQ